MIYWIENMDEPGESIGIDPDHIEELIDGERGQIEVAAFRSILYDWLLIKQAQHRQAPKGKQ